jgi:hypothetical protein
MVHIIKLSKTFWAEAISIACYIQNWVSISTKPETPYEFWTRHKPKIDHLRIFSCICYVHIPSKNEQSGTLKQGHKLYDHQF